MTSLLFNFVQYYRTVYSSSFAYAQEIFYALKIMWSLCSMLFVRGTSARLHMYQIWAPFGRWLDCVTCCELLVDCPPLPNCLSFWVHLVGAWNLTWYQSQRSRVRVLVEASFKSSAPFFISTFAPCSGCTWVGVLWSISGLPTSSQTLKLLGSLGWCMKPNKWDGGRLHAWTQFDQEL